jgi:hypothetical protein
LSILHPAWVAHHRQAPSPCHPCRSALCSSSYATRRRGPAAPEGESVSCGDCPIPQGSVCRHEDASQGGIVAAATVRQDNEHHDGAREEDAYPPGVGSVAAADCSTRAS